MKWNKEKKFNDIFLPYVNNKDTQSVYAYATDILFLIMNKMGLR